MKKNMCIERYIGHIEFVPLGNHIFPLPSFCTHSKKEKKMLSIHLVWVGADLELQLSLADLWPRLSQSGRFSLCLQDHELREWYKLRTIEATLEPHRENLRLKWSRWEQSPELETKFYNLSCSDYSLFHLLDYSFRSVNNIPPLSV